MRIYLDRVYANPKPNFLMVSDFAEYEANLAGGDGRVQGLGSRLAGVGGFLRRETIAIRR